MKMPWGKHRGRDLVDVPDAYLDWMMTSAKLLEPLRSAVCREWQARFDPRASAILFDGDVQSAALQIVSTGYRHLAREHHPDVGGATGTMQSLNAAQEWLRRTIREKKAVHA